MNGKYSSSDELIFQIKEKYAKRKKNILDNKKYSKQQENIVNKKKNNLKEKTIF